MKLENLTPFAAISHLSMDRAARTVLVTSVAGTFRLPSGDASPDVELELADVQHEPPLADVHRGEAGKSSLRFEAQSAFVRDNTDITVSGHAAAPEGREVRRQDVHVRVGAYAKSVVVYGDRTWRRSPLGLKPSAPEPFERIPLIYERAFGGGEPSDVARRKPTGEARNPVGVGFYASRGDAAGAPLPNIEDPLDPIRSWRDRPRPAGFGPIDRSWQPRVALAGTYDETWLEERAPFWPHDFDERYFRAASSGLTTDAPLVGGEEVELSGFWGNGAQRFRLPRVRLKHDAEFKGHAPSRRLSVALAHLDTDAGELLMIWRCEIDAQGIELEHLGSTLRMLEEWEDRGA